MLSVIIPHWNGIHHLDDCLTALRQQTHRDFEVLLVDNGSADGSQAHVRQHFPEVRLIELGTNRGFTGACLAGWAHARGDIIILLNNDTAAHPGWLAALAATFDQQPQVGIVASRLLLFDRRDTLHAAGDFYRVDGIPGNRGVWEQDTGQYDDQREVFSACGAAAAYRRTMLEEIGFLSADFFFSCEDVDMGWRAQLAGWDVRYAPEAIVWHKLKATGGNVTASYYDGRNVIWLIVRNYPGSLLRHHWRAILRAQREITRQALRHWRGAEARARLRGQLAGVLGIGRMLPARRRIQALRRASDARLLSRLTESAD
jgi:GT2 family glycosyltransferase